MAVPALCALVVACAHAKPDAVGASHPPDGGIPAVTSPVAGPAGPSSPSSSGTCGRDDQCAASELCVGARCVPIVPGMAECGASAHFDFDRAVLRAEDLASLQRAARCLRALPPATALVEGRCDERGTAQYNVALGFRRAHAATAYLKELGVSKSTLQEVSYGKEHPLCADSTETCWARNRRADVARGGAPRKLSARDP